MASYELSGSVSEKEKHFVETWENVADGVNYIIRENRRGDEQYDQITGQRKFKLTTYDRMLTEDKIVDHRYNPFKNGSFRPVVVPDNVTVDSNPNAMSVDDIRRVFAASDEAWDAYMDVIDSPATLKRMLDLADGETEISHRRYTHLQSMFDRYSNVGKPMLRQKDAEQYDSIPGSQTEPIASPRRGRPARTV